MTSAGEVEQFAYCAHNWWLARNAAPPTTHSGRHGVQAHVDLGQAQGRIERQKSEYRRAWAWFFRVVAVACGAVVLTLEVVYLRSFEHIVILVAATSVLVAGAAALMLLAAINRSRYKRAQATAGLVPGRLVATDLGGAGPLLHDAQFGLSGRPDYVLETKSGFVPVEVKSGKAPRRPHDNHRLQLACYLRLLEVKTGTPPPYGLLNYADGVFRVAWDEAARADLQAVLGRIEQARQAGRADRDHEQPGRCRGCARRDLCLQRLA